MIKNKRGQMVPLEPNWAQRMLVNAVLKDLSNGLPVRYIILKARQMGLSTIIEALGFWWVTTNKYQNAVIIAHKKKAAKNLYKMFRRYYENAQPPFRPRRKYNTKDDLTFDISDEEKEKIQAQDPRAKLPGLQSEIQTMVAGEGEGRSDTILFFHGSEVAFWDQGSDVLSSALQAIPLFENTFAFLESTANGVGGYFFDEWQHAKKGDSSFKAFFFPWHAHPEYMLPGKITVYDEEELELLEIFKEQGYPEEDWNKKLTWRRKKKQEFHSEPEKFYQEYPKDDMEAFLASGRPVFDIRQLVKMENYAEKAEKPRYGIIQKGTSAKGKLEYGVEFVPVTIEGNDPTPLKIWELPDKNERYTIAVDVSEGIEKNSEGGVADYSVIDVMKTSNLKTVARYRGHIDPDLLAEEAFGLGTFYNFALIGPEINNHGLVVAQKLRDMFYRNMYQRETNEEEQFQQRTSRMGWRTDRKTKPIIINELAKAIRDSDIIDTDIVFIRECMTYVRDDQGHTSAQENMFDDCVMAKAINLQMANWSSYDIDYAKEAIVKPTKRQGDESTNTNTGRRAGTAKLRTRQRVRTVRR